MTCPRSSTLVDVDITSVIGVIVHPFKMCGKKCIKGVLGVLKVYLKRCCVTPRQKVFKRCALKVYFQRYTLSPDGLI